jgi:Fe-coproporphyrin III synthase
MISVSRLLCDEIGPGDHLRYGHEGRLSSASEARPIVVWNYTRQCNLRCIHCYADATTARTHEGEMNLEEGKAFIRQLADFQVPVLLFSGGEPLIRDDFLELASFGASNGLGLTLSTNGTLITLHMAREMRNIGFREVGISLDGIGQKNDVFRGKKGAYEAALTGIRNCISAGQRVSLRMTVTRANYSEIPAIFDLVEQEKIDRVCF